MTTVPTCPRCSRVIWPEDTVEQVGDHVEHLDCREPRRLSVHERALLYQYCWDHAVARCVSCARSLRQSEFSTGDDIDRCPRCHADLTDEVRAHLYGCAMLPAEVRRRAQELREAAQGLVKHSGQLHDAADVLMRESEALVTSLRHSASGALRRVIRFKLHDGSLPYDGIPHTIPGRPGDGAPCAACQHLITSHGLMFIATVRTPRSSPSHAATPVPLHADCLRLWEEERQPYRR